MRISTRARSALATVTAAALIVTGAIFASPAAIAAITPPPDVKIAALGDSITLATSSCSSFSSCVANSWSTGTTASVGSHASRLTATPGVTSVTRFNNAVNGTKVAGLNTQAIKAISQGANYVTIEIGANDACTSTVGGMTSPEAFRAGINSALSTLATGASAPKVFLASIPNLYRMYDLNRGSSSARLTWGLLRICQSMLANPTSIKPADMQRRLDVQARVDLFNAILADECNRNFAAICRFDSGAVADYNFQKSDISTRDYFHPSLAGQTNLARITWDQTPWVK